jgi:hypothetical protein
MMMMMEVVMINSKAMINPTMRMDPMIAYLVEEDSDATMRNISMIE